MPRTLQKVLGGWVARGWAKNFESGKIIVQFFFGPTKFWVQKKIGGGRVITVGPSCLDYEKPTYQILASYYA